MMLLTLLISAHVEHRATPVGESVTFHCMLGIAQRSWQNRRMSRLLNALILDHSLTVISQVSSMPWQHGKPSVMTQSQNKTLIIYEINLALRGDFMACGPILENNLNVNWIHFTSDLCLYQHPFPSSIQDTSHSEPSRHYETDHQCHYN